MKNIEKMTERELRNELRAARVAMLAMDAALNAKQFENIGFYQTAGHAINQWKEKAGYEGDRP